MFLLHVVTVKPTIKYNEGWHRQSYNAGKTGQLSTPEKFFRKKTKTENKKQHTLNSGEKKKKQFWKRFWKLYPKKRAAQIPILLIFDQTPRHQAAEAMPEMQHWVGPHCPLSPAAHGPAGSEQVTQLLLATSDLSQPGSTQPPAHWNRSYSRLGNSGTHQDTIVVRSWVLKNHFLLFCLKIRVLSLPLCISFWSLVLFNPEMQKEQSGFEKKQNHHPLKNTR